MTATPTREDDLTRKLVEENADLKRRVKTLEALPADNLEIKTTTGDFSTGDSWNGRRVLNTFDNNYKIFSEGSWRTIVSY